SPCWSYQSASTKYRSSGSTSTSSPPSNSSSSNSVISSSSRLSVREKSERGSDHALDRVFASHAVHRAFGLGRGVAHAHESRQRAILQGAISGQQGTCPRWDSPLQLGDDLGRCP